MKLISKVPLRSTTLENYALKVMSIYNIKRQNKIKKVNWHILNVQQWKKTSYPLAIGNVNPMSKSITVQERL